MKRLLLLLPLLFATPALAQTTTQPAPAAPPAKVSEFETVSLAIYGPCSRVTFTDAAAATSAQTTCAKLFTDMDIVKQAAGANITPHEMNIYHLIKSAASLRVGRAYLALDNNARTARVCTQMEQAWTHGAQVNMAASPAEYAKLMAPMVNDAAGITRTCRTEYGTPAGATPLPPQ